MESEETKELIIGYILCQGHTYIFLLIKIAYIKIKSYPLQSWIIQFKKRSEGFSPQMHYYFDIYVYLKNIHKKESLIL